MTVRDSLDISKSRQIHPLVASNLNRKQSFHCDTHISLKHPRWKPSDVYKVMLTKVFLEPEKVTENDKLVIFTLYENLKELRSNFYNSPFKCSSIELFTEERLIKNLTDDPSFIQTTGLKHILLQSDLIFKSKREYYGKLGQKNLEITLNFSRRATRRHEAKYIGVGYKDKGCSPKTNIDGSPSWQEVGSSIDNFYSLKLKKIDFRDLEITGKNLAVTVPRKENFRSDRAILNFKVLKFKEQSGRVGFLVIRPRFRGGENLTNEILDLQRISKKLQSKFEPLIVDDQIGLFVDKLNKSNLIL